MSQTFEDTVSFELKPGLSSADTEETLGKIRSIRGVFSLESTGNPGVYDVKMNGQDTALGVMDTIRWQGNIRSVTLTPAEFHELRARNAAMVP